MPWSLYKRTWVSLLTHPLIKAHRATTHLLRHLNTPANPALGVQDSRKTFSMIQRLLRSLLLFSLCICKMNADLVFPQLQSHHPHTGHRAGRAFCCVCNSRYGNSVNLRFYPCPTSLVLPPAVTSTPSWNENLEKGSSVDGKLVYKPLQTDSTHKQHLHSPSFIRC